MSNNQEVKLPEIGEGVTEGELVQWLVKEGDTVEVDQPVAEMMTDKATVEIPSPKVGLVGQLKFKEGDTVEVGQTLLTLKTESGKQNPSPSQPQKQESLQTSPDSIPSSSPLSSNTNLSSTSITSPSPSSASSTNITPPVTEEHVLATPATRRLARELGISLNNMVGSGLAGRVTYEDVLQRGEQLQQQKQQGQPSMEQPLMEQSPSSPESASKNIYRTKAEIQPHPPQPHRGGFMGNGLSPFMEKDLIQMEERIPFRGLRRKIAENMQLSKRIIPHFTLMDEAKVSSLVRLRESVKNIGKKEGFSITYLPFIMKALVATLRQFPMLNASIDDKAGEVIYRRYYNIGFAADTPKGLMVPVIHGVENKSILKLSQEISSLSQKAREGRLTPQNMQGGTITITNIGSIGGTYATPVILYPQVAILGIYKITEKPIAKKGKLKIIQSMNLTITADHRLIDGAVAAYFLQSLISKLEKPGVLMLHMN